MAVGCEDRQGRFDDVMLLVGDRLAEGGVYRLLAEHGAAQFGDESYKEWIGLEDKRSEDSTEADSRRRS